MKRLITLAFLALLVPACGRGGGRPTPKTTAIVASADRVLFQYARPGFASTTLTGPGLGNNMALQGLDYDPLTGQLLAVDSDSQQLFRIHPTTGALTPVGVTGFAPRGLAFDPGARILYASTMHRHLVSIDLATGLATDIGPTNGPQLQGLAFDPGSGTLYGTEDPTTNLYTVNPATGNATLLMGAPGVSGLAFDPNTGLLYGWVTLTHQLVKINPATSATTFLGGGGTIDILGMAYISSSNRLMAVSRTDLYEVNLTTGALTWIAQIGEPTPSDLAWDPLLNVFYGVSGTNFCSISPAGTMTKIAATGNPGPGITGVAFNPGPRTLYATTLSDLLTINLTTGAPTTIGATGYTTLLDLTYDPGSSTLFAMTLFGELVTINPATGAGTLVGSPAVAGIHTLAINPGTGTLYATSSSTNSLYTLNKATAAATLVGTLITGAGSTLEFSTADGMLYAAAPHLTRIHPATAVTTPFNGLGYEARGLAWDPDQKILYGATGNSPLLYQVNTTTWAATFVATVATPLLFNGFTFDRDQDTLWAIDINRSLIRINPATGGPTAVGATGIFPTCIAYHPELGVLYAVDLVGSDRLFTLNTSTGASTLVGPIGFTDLAAMAYDPKSGKLLAYDAATDQFVEIDPATGAGTAVGRARRLLSALTVTD